MRHGDLDNTGGRAAYRKKITHAGYSRYVISTNPPLYDEDGDLYSPLDSGDEAANHRAASPIEDDPFSGVRLEELLRPLTAASELATHPSLSVPYKSKALTQMVDQTSEMLRRERASLWKAKQLLLRFRGDADWVPSETFETEVDEMMLLPGNENDGLGERGTEELGSAVPSVPDLIEPVTVTVERQDGNASGEQEQVNTVMVDAMDGVEAVDMALQQAVEAQDRAETDARTVQELEKEGKEMSDGRSKSDANHHLPTPSGEPETGVADAPASAIDNPALSDARRSAERAHEGGDGAESEHTSGSGKETNGTSTNVHAMTTRARARSPVATSTSPAPSSAASDVPAISPWFLIPPTSLPDRDCGLPPAEADQTRKLLLSYVQKQDQIVRSLETLYSGLSRADRLRRDIFRSAKAQGHVHDDGRGNMVTDMSDGEDWYDPEDWGLTKADLRVGKDGQLGLEKGKDELEDNGVGVEDEGRKKRVARAVKVAKV